MSKESETRGRAASVHVTQELPWDKKEARAIGIRENYSALPWRIKGESYGNYIAVGNDERTVARVPWGAQGTTHDDANAKLIVRACNYHDRLVQALEDLVEDCERGDVPRTATARNILQELQRYP